MTANTNEVQNQAGIVPSPDAVIAAANPGTGPAVVDTSLANAPTAGASVPPPPGVSTVTGAPAPDPAAAAAAGANVGAAAAGAGTVGGASAGAADVAVGRVNLSLEQRIANLESAVNGSSNEVAVSESDFNSLRDRVTAIEGSKEHPDAESNTLTSRVNDLFRRIFGE